MNKDLLEKLEGKLKEDKKDLVEKLKSFATKDKDLKGDWDTKFPQYSKGGNNSDLDIATEEVEDYINLLPVEHILEIRLTNVESALKKIKTNKYGFCEGCGKEISIKRLEISPEAKLCIHCKETQKNN